MKSKTLGEIQSARKRTLQLLGMKRINKGDADYIVARLEEIEARIQKMEERPINREERQLW